MFSVVFAAHPFSISSSPKQSTVTLHIRRAGDWTDALHRLALKTNEVSILIEGPYGNLSMNLFGSDRYKYVVLVCGGIGSMYSSTSLRSCFESWIREH
jgi:NADPH oxidase